LNDVKIVAVQYEIQEEAGLHLLTIVYTLPNDARGSLAIALTDDEKLDIGGTILPVMHDLLEAKLLGDTFVPSVPSGE